MRKRRASLRLIPVAILAVVFPSIMGPLGWGAACPVVAQTPPSEARHAFLNRDYDQAVTLYWAQLALTPNDPEATAGLVETMLRKQKWVEAEALAERTTAAVPNNAMILTALVEAEVRGGEPWTGWAILRSAVAADPCYPRAHLLMSRLARMRSMYATAQDEARLAHQLDPHDGEIWSEWIFTLPPADRMRELEAYLASPPGNDPDGVRHMQQLLDLMKNSADMPRKACRLATSKEITELPFVNLMADIDHIRAFGLNVKLNHAKLQLQIDTGASGIVVGRSAAQRAGLKPASQTEMSGIGSKGVQTGYTAYADTIDIGGLEFKDCMVQVIDSRTVTDEDGVIGTDVFSNFLVTLDFPMRKMGLSPLPARPDEVVTAPTLKSGEQEGDTRNAEKDPAQKAEPHGPYDRYIAPAMQDWTPVFREGHQLLLPVQLDQKATRLFILDTGTWMTSISPDAARLVTKIHSAKDDLKVRGISGLVRDTYFADEVTFSFAHLTQKVAQVPAWDLSNVSQDTGMEVSGFIGAKTIELMTLKIDYRDGLIHFDYAANRGRSANSIFSPGGAW
jgi:tetratricopeptide (TPR) repeat protein